MCLSSCAAINGINQAIVSRANELATLSARGENLIAACAVLTSEEAQVLGEAVRSPNLIIMDVYADMNLQGCIGEEIPGGGFIGEG